MMTHTYLTFRWFRAVLVSVLLHGPAAAEIFDTLEGVTWDPASGVPTAMALIGRHQLILLSDPSVKESMDAVGHLYAMTEWHFANEVDVAYLTLMAKNDPFGKNKKEGYIARLPAGVDDGTLLRAFGIKRPYALLWITPDGRLRQFLTLADLTEEFYKSLCRDDDCWPMMPHENRAPQPVSVGEHDAIAWFLASDMTRSLDLLHKAEHPAFVKDVRQRVQAAVKHTCESYAKGDAIAKYLAYSRLMAVTAEFPEGMTAEGRTVISKGQSDKSVKAEVTAMQGFKEYVHAVKTLKGPDSDAKQEGLLKALVTKHPGTYAASLAALIIEGTQPTAPKK